MNHICFAAFGNAPKIRAFGVFFPLYGTAQKEIVVDINPAFSFYTSDKITELSFS